MILLGITFQLWEIAYGFSGTTRYKTTLLLIALGCCQEYCFPKGQSISSD